MYQNKIRLMLFVLIYLIFYFSTSSPLVAQTGHTYPRVGIFHFSGGRPEYEAKYDLIMTLREDGAYADEIHRIERDVIHKTKLPAYVIAAICDWNTFSGELPNDQEPPDSWRVVDSDENDCHGYNTNVRLMDVTKFCPREDYGGLQNVTYGEFMGNWMVQSFKKAKFDGLMSHGIWTYPYSTRPGGGTGDVDLNRNGENDWDEMERSGIDAIWQEGVQVIIDLIKAQIGNKILILNSGGFHTCWWKDHNGVFEENTPTIWSPANWISNYQGFNSVAREPQTVYMDAIADNDEMFANMRAMLAFTNFYGGYFGYSERASREHRYDGWYDEFELNLGYPTSDVYQLLACGPDKEGIYCQFYDKGAVIANISFTPHSVSDADISAFDEYAGPYYRFKGGQVPDFNNGEKFTSVSLSGNR